MNCFYLRKDLSTVTTLLRLFLDCSHLKNQQMHQPLKLAKEKKTIKDDGYKYLKEANITLMVS